VSGELSVDPLSTTTSLNRRCGIDVVGDAGQATPKTHGVILHRDDEGNTRF
jgi:hypothetical protein